MLQGTTTHHMMYMMSDEEGKCRLTHCLDIIDRLVALDLDGDDLPHLVCDC